MHTAHIRPLNLRTLDARLLLAFEALLAEGSISRAATRVALSQPAMSRTLVRLRRVFGDPLFRRVDGRMLPTGRALELAPRVAAALDALTALRSKSRFDPATCRAAVRIAATEYGAALVLPGVLQQLARQAPQVAVEIVGWSDGTLDDLRAGFVDLALGVPNLPSPGLASDVLFEDALHCLLRRGHPLARRGARPRDYAMHPHIMISTGAGGAVTGVDAALNELGLTRAVALRVSSFLAAAAIVARTQMVLTMPARLAQLFCAALPLVSRSPPVALPPIVYRQLWPERLTDSPLHAWLRSVLRDTGGGLMADGTRRAAPATTRGRRGNPPVDA